MYLRSTPRRNKDGSEVRYLQFAHNVWDPQKRRSTVQVVYNFGREEPSTREALERLVASVARHLEPGKAKAIAAEALADEAAASMDLVCCLEMLEHVPDPPAIVGACAKLVKPGGLVFFSTINRNAKSFAFAIVGAEYVLGLLPKGTHEYARFIRPSELSRACRDAGLAVFDLTGMSYNPFAKVYSLGRDVDVNYLLGARRG